jgi:hypothetical protein
LVPGSGAEKSQEERNVSDNYRFYAEKMNELRVGREANRPLLGQLHQLFVFVRECEAQWESRGMQSRDRSGDA